MNDIIKLLPEGKFKTNVICFYYSYFKKNDFKMVFKDDHFVVKFDNGIEIKSYDNPYGDDIKYLNKGYLKNYKLKEGDIVVDAGAYTGMFSIYAAKIVGSFGKIIAFEPDPINFEKLKKNILLNRLENIIPINKGLWSKNTILEFNVTGKGSSSVVEKKNSPVKTITKISVIRLDDELKKVGINKVNFVKMDIEGAEVEAIKGCSEILKTNNINLAIASYHIVNGTETHFELEKLLLENGYNSIIGFPQHLTTYAWKE